jgi:hypothetical protein
MGSMDPYRVEIGFPAAHGCLSKGLRDPFDLFDFHCVSDKTCKGSLLLLAPMTR